MITTYLARLDHLSYQDGLSDRLGQDSNGNEFLTLQQLRYRSKSTYKNRDSKRSSVFRKSWMW